MAKRLIWLGLHPDVVDWEKWPSLSPEKLIKGAEATKELLASEGYEVTIGFVKTGEAGVEEATALLEGDHYDLALIGAGVRKDDDQFLFFEKLINVIHTHAPSAKIAFNTNPNDTLDAVKRWI